MWTSRRSAALPSRPQNPDPVRHGSPESRSLAWLSQAASLRVSDCLARQARSARIALGSRRRRRRSRRKERLRSLLLRTAARDPYLIASLAKLAVSNGSLRSLRCSLGAAVFVGSDETIVSQNQICSGGVSSAPPADRRREHRGRGSRWEAAAVVVARGGKNASARSSSERRRAIRI